VSAIREFFYVHPDSSKQAILVCQRAADDTCPAAA